MLEGCDIDDLDEGSDEARRYKSLTHGKAPDEFDCATVDEAIVRAADLAAGWQGESDGGEGWTTAVIAGSAALRDSLAGKLESTGRGTAIIDRRHAETTDPRTIYLSTMHRAKGLEFDQVVLLITRDVRELPEVSADLRRLAYVALTRAKRRAVLVTMP